MPLVVMEAIVPEKALDIQVFRDEIERALEQEVDVINRLYDGVYRNWKGTGRGKNAGKVVGSNKPDWEKNFRITTSEAWGEIKTTSIPFVFLDEGTTVRHAILSRNWKSKTRPGSLRSGSGGGRVLGVSGNYPGRGIDARNWSKTIAKMREKPFHRRMEKAMERAAARA